MDKIKSHLLAGGRAKPATLFVFKQGDFVKMNDRGLNQSLSHLLLQGMQQMGCLPEAFTNRRYAGRLTEKIFKALLTSLKGPDIEEIQNFLSIPSLIPAAIMIISGLPGRKIMGKHAPLTTRFQDIQNRIDDGKFAMNTFRPSTDLPEGCYYSSSLMFSFIF